MPPISNASLEAGTGKRQSPWEGTRTTFIKGKFSQYLDPTLVLHSYDPTMINDSDVYSLSSSYDSSSSLPTSQFSNPSPSNLWEYDPAFGIVHHCGCRICRNYMMHICDAEDADTSYTHAIQERDTVLRKQFLDGFRRGRTTQQHHDNERLKQCRAQRNESRALNSIYELRIEEAQKEIASIKDELLALQIAYSELRPRTPSETSDWLGYGEADSDDGVSPWDDSDSPDLVDDTDDSASDAGSEGNHSSAESLEEISDGVSVEDAEEIDGPLEGPTNDVIEPLDHISSEFFTATDEPNHLPILSLSAISFCLDDEPGQSSIRSTNLSSPLEPTHRQTSTPSSTFPSTPHPQSGNTTLEEIRRTMRLAHSPGQFETLALVKYLVSDAHLTPAYQRTETQKVLLAEWRRPSPTSVDVPPQEVYVDASASGIGFYYKGQWQAWMLKAGWRRAKHRDIQWAEAVAVELGLLLMLQAGYSNRKIVLRSDNRQVVEAVSKSCYNQSQVGPIVRYIDSLCLKNNIDLVVTWIPGAENPADAPSRLSVRDESQRFPYEITIPSHLHEFVLPYRCRA